MKVLVTAILLASTLGCSANSGVRYMRPTDQPLIDRAIEIYAKGKISKEEVLRDMEPAVVYLPDMTCVGLNLRRGVLGGDTTICFDKNGRQVLFYVSGD